MSKLTQIVTDSQMTRSDIARRLGITPQAVGQIVNAQDAPPKVATLAGILLAIGWTREQVADIRIGDFYDLAEL